MFEKKVSIPESETYTRQCYTWFIVITVYIQTGFQLVKDQAHLNKKNNHTNLHFLFINYSSFCVHTFSFSFKEKQ